MKKILESLNDVKDKKIYSSKGLPKIKTKHEIKGEIKEYFEQFGGIELFPNKKSPVTLVNKKQFVPMNDNFYTKENKKMFKEEEEDYEEWISHNWYALADIENGNYIAIDLSPERYGYCYLAEWEVYVLRNENPIIALSLKEFIERTIETKGKKYYWEEKDFKSYGDANE